MKKFDQINVIPFIDIMLVLLAIVLTSASFISQGKIPVTPPTSRTITALDDSIRDSRLITIQHSGALYLDDQPISASELESRISGWNNEQNVNLKIDAQAPFAHFIRIGDMLRAHDIHRVNILASPESGVASP